ncbi:Fic family protein [Kordiimonas aquimaris]|uniref:Fic family protein n=1 Tax=Kordiimonas aquimaris TaxID=707591 RepID=UPI0021D15967|nr:Fic family protein [Kordiimonas aquimaris]
MNYTGLTQKKDQLDGFRPLPPALVQNLEQWFLIELTYTSNAIEGNTLTRRETAAVVEKGLTIGGKSLVEHLEATNHAKALNGIVALAESKTTDLSENDILTIHNTILRGIDDDNAGHYRSIPVRISGSTVILPNPAKVPELMQGFMAGLVAKQELHPVELAAKAHYDLVTIHPFVDGNGRTARLLMNLILLQHGYPPALIRKRDRLKYISGLEKAQLGGPSDKYYKVIYDAVNRSLDIYLDAVSGKDEKTQPSQETKTLLRIGQLAKQSGESNATLRYWTKEGLLSVADTTASGYQLYDPDTVERVKAIRDLQAQRYTLAEIKTRLPK